MGFEDYYGYPTEGRDSSAAPATGPPKGFPPAARETFPGEDEEEEEKEEQQPSSHHPPDVSQSSYSSGIHTFYTPDSATSPNSPPSPQSSQKLEERSGGKKAKTRTAFSQKQLQILHHRFQSQKYLSPQQIRELASALELTYKQIKTWFQNQRMKFKRTQKESLWVRKGMCPPQNGYLDINPNYHQGFSIGEARNIHALAGMHENFVNSNQPYAANQNYSSDYQMYGNPQNLYQIVSAEDGTIFGKAAGASYNQQAMNYLSQQKINFYHGFSTSMEYASVKTEDGYPFPNVSANDVVTFPGTSALQHYQAPFQTQGAQSN